MPDRPIILWLRQDLRLADHRALAAACATGAPIVPLYILDDDSPARWRMGAASRWWLAGSLNSLAADLEARGVRLVLRKGPADKVLAAAAEETGAGAVYCSRAYEPWAGALEQKLKQALAERHVDFKRYGGTLIAEPERLRTGAGDPYRVYTPFWRALSSTIEVPRPFPAPETVRGLRKKIAGDTVRDWQLEPAKPDWAKGFRAAWRPGEAGAHERLAAFVDGPLATYHEERDQPDSDGTSRLSPHLHFGEVSPAQCWMAAVARLGNVPAKSKGLETFLKELGWREFSYHLLHHWPRLPETPFRPEFAAYPWQENAGNLKAWQKGLTGYPIVDAGMRQLWTTGWMHNRVRMIVASFLIKDLLIPWQTGEAWFWDTLVDADLASNAASWQWVAGSGADAAPYFRIFNPVTQGEKFDATGTYVRHWVPEIRALPDAHIHAPWLAPESVLSAAGLRLGRDYPLPIIDHADARDRALAGYEKVKAPGVK